MTPSPSQKPVIHTLKNIVKHEKNVIHMANGCPIILNTSYPINELISGSPPDSSTMNSEAPTWDLTTYKNRLRTFNSEWKLDFITPSQMAKAGFYYLGKQDRVRCMFCSQEFDYWQRGDDPLVEHKRKAPQCPFFNENQGYDVCGLFGSPTNDCENDNEDTKKIELFLDSVGVVQQIRAPKHKEYASFESRLKTFDKCEINLKQDINTLSEAGFFYIGDGHNDQMLCFCCSQGLKDWEDDDEPWTEHARWSPTCSYLLLSKGKNFVDEACGIKDEVTTMTHEEICKLITDHQDTSILENNIKVNSAKRKIDHLEIAVNDEVKTSLPKASLRLSQQDLNTIPDSMLCKICYKDEMKVAFIPCGHVIACIQCAMTLDQCAVCRQPFSMAMRVHVCVDEQKDEDLDQLLPCSSSQCSDEPADPMLCKICHKEEMEAAFIPCRHVYACVKCATEIHDCPACEVGICATMQVYL